MLVVPIAVDDVVELMLGSVLVVVDEVVVVGASTTIRAVSPVGATV